MAKKAKLNKKTRPAKKRSQAVSSRRKAAAKKVTRKRNTTRIELKHVPWHTVELEDLNPLFQRQFIVGHEIMVARILMKKGSIVPLHSHHNEQISYVLEGALKFGIDGKVIVVNAGEVLAIPPHMPHSAEAIVDAVSLDVFNPPRADWINKTDQYLRGGK